MALDDRAGMFSQADGRRGADGLDHVHANARGRGSLTPIFDMTPVVVEGRVVSTQVFAVEIDVAGVCKWTNSGNGIRMDDVMVLRCAQPGDVVMVRLPAYIARFAGWAYSPVGDA